MCATAKRPTSLDWVFCVFLRRGFYLESLMIRIRFVFWVKRNKKNNKRKGERSASKGEKVPKLLFKFGISINNNQHLKMADLDVDVDVEHMEEIIETGSIRKTVRRSYIIQEVSISLLFSNWISFEWIVCKNVHNCQYQKRQIKLEHLYLNEEKTYKFFRWSNKCSFHINFFIVAFGSCLNFNFNVCSLWLFPMELNTK